MLQSIIILAHEQEEHIYLADLHGHMMSRRRSAGAGALSVIIGTDPASILKP